MEEITPSPLKCDPLIITFIEMFQNEKYGYKVLISSVVVNLFEGLYNKLVKEGLDPIEMLIIGEKEKYWNLAKTYYKDKLNAIKAAKVAYILDKITNA